jgi:hypothetical protein
MFAGIDIGANHLAAKRNVVRPANGYGDVMGVDRKRVCLSPDVKLSEVAHAEVSEAILSGDPSLSRICNSSPSVSDVPT